MPWTFLSSPRLEGRCGTEPASILLRQHLRRWWTKKWKDSGSLNYLMEQRYPISLELLTLGPCIER